MINQSIEGKNIIIAGGAKNLGGLIAREFSAHKVKSIAVHYHNSNSKAEADSTVSALRANGVDAMAFQYDLSENGAMKSLFDESESVFGKADIAINTVGKVLKKPMTEISDEEYDLMSSVNTKVAFLFLREAGRRLNDNGRICTIVTSLLGAFTPNYAAYAGTKAPVEHFTRAAAQEFGARGISVTALGPGPMDTPFFYPAESRDAQAYHKTASALSGFSKTGLTDIADIVPWVRFLVSEGWWMTGQTILVNGGYTTK
ncbi:SDR family oxidoreductase [Klebsiella aerogenes]|uniref:SDR family oxidoreductase n=1 Tax=Klebsiella aerogenes TaxID=548 RepID=UPI001F379C4D|nr:SDR family oxidoreductase [Klebsiella aerogenes]